MGTVELLKIRTLPWQESWCTWVSLSLDEK